MLIELRPVYECSKCKSIFDEKDIEITITELSRIVRCPICGNDNLILLKLED